MNFLDQVKLVKEDLLQRQKQFNDGPYVGVDIHEAPIDNPSISKERWMDILEYLDKKGFTGTGKQGGKLCTLLLPAGKPTIDPKSLKLISKELSKHYSEKEVIELLRDSGIDEKIIAINSDIEGLLCEILTELSTNRNNRKDRELLLTTISKAIHPLNLGGDLELSKSLKEKFDYYLGFDYLKIFDTCDNDVYSIERVYSSDDDDFMDNIYPHMQEEWFYKLIELKKENNREEILKIKVYFKALMNVVEFFCADLAPTEELNKVYIDLRKAVFNPIVRLELRRYDEFTSFNYIRPPFDDLYSAEKKYIEQKKVLSWDLLRPSMNLMYRDIEALCEKVGISGLLVPLDIQKKLDDVKILLSNLKETKRIEKIRNSSPNITKVEITKMPEVKVKGFEEKVILQKPSKQRIQLRHFPKDLKWESVTIQFINGHDVIIEARGVERIETNYKGLGFEDERKKLPDKQWEFLTKLSNLKGEFTWQSQGASGAVKKQKEKLEKGLIAYFQIDSSPFHEYRKEKMYRIKINLIPEEGSSLLPTKQELSLEKGLGLEEFYKDQTPLVYNDLNK